MKTELPELPDPLPTVFVYGDNGPTEREPTEALYSIGHLRAFAQRHGEACFAAGRAHALYDIPKETRELLTSDLRRDLIRAYRSTGNDLMAKYHECVLQDAGLLQTSEVRNDD